MIRFAHFGLVALITSSAFAEPPKDVTVTLGVQRAMSTAREFLRKNQSAEAVAVLEGELVNADGSANYLKLLREAYASQLRELQFRKADSTAIESVRSRLKSLDGPTSPSIPKSETRLGTSSPPPIPEPPAEPLGPTPVPLTDPFQQVPRDDLAKSDNIVRASAAFADKRYPQAANLFAEAERAKETFSAAQRDEWAYSRLHGVALRMNRDGTKDRAELGREVELALKLGTDRVRPFGNELLSKLGGSPPVETGWQIVEGANFRVLHRNQSALAADVARTAESVRTAMYERWFGPAPTWAPKCDIYLNGATGSVKSTVASRGDQVVSRRIDLRADAPTLLDGPLPHEVTQVLLADLFADQPLPRWALVGMAGLSESSREVGRYRQAIPGLLKEKKLFKVEPFLERTDFPTADSITAFYAESVSLVAYLVELRGPKAFAAFLREGPRRGYAKALNSHYGIKDAAELQDKWLRHAVAAD